MKIVIGGDVVPAESNQQLFTEGKADELFGKILSLFEGADRVLVNLECALTHCDKPITKMGPNIKSIPETVAGIAKAGITDCFLSNNHSFDYGSKGLADTALALEKAGIGYSGIGINDTDSRKPCIIEKDGMKIAVIAVCEHEYTYALPNRIGANPYDPYDTMADIRKAKSENDYVIVLYHGGKEYSQYPSPRLHKLCRAMSDNGADAVFCQHSHCIGCYENYNDCHILYGQGNFHFIRSDREDWKTGLVVTLDFDNDVKIKFDPVYTKESCMELADGELREKLLSEFRQRSENLQNGKWLDGWREFCIENAELYTNIVRLAYADENDDYQKQYFAHFLDCEAHEDVWHELFKTWNHLNELDG